MSFASKLTWINFILLIVSFILIDISGGEMTMEEFLKNNGVALATLATLFTSMISLLISVKDQRKINDILVKNLPISLSEHDHDIKKNISNHDYEIKKNISDHDKDIKHLFDKNAEVMNKMASTMEYVDKIRIGLTDKNINAKDVVQFLDSNAEEMNDMKITIKRLNAQIEELEKLNQELKEELENYRNLDNSLER